MEHKSIIQSVQAWEVLDSRGFPTLEVELFLSDGSVGRAIVPSGASTGSHEALELRDKEPNRFLGRGVLQAAENVNAKIASRIKGLEVDQFELDHTLIDLDGTPNKSSLGANAILGVSLAFAKARAQFLNQPLYAALSDLPDLDAFTLPTPLVNVINGGVHASNNLDVQEFMLIPLSGASFKEAIFKVAEVFHSLKKILLDKKLSVAVGDEGGFAFNVGSHVQALDLLMQAIEQAGYVPGVDMGLALDVAATEFYKDDLYHFEGSKISGQELLNMYKAWVEQYPILSIEDPFAEDDWESWQAMVQDLPQIQIVGDDLFVTNVNRLKRGIEASAANALLVKMNQIGTLTETIQATRMAQAKGWNAVISHRSGESEDTSISHLSLALSTGQIKTGSVCRSERVAKYNELIRIESALGSRGVFLGGKVYGASGRGSIKK